MLTHVEIKQFRSCRDVLLENLGSITVLAGRNAVGKTNILQAIRWLAETATSLQSVHTSDDHGQVSVQVSLGRTVYHYTLSVEVPGTERRNWLLVESLSCEENGKAQNSIFRRRGSHVALTPSESQVEVGAAVPCMPALASLLPGESPILRLMGPFLLFLNGIRYYPFENEQDEGDTGVVLHQRYETWLAQSREGEAPGPSVILRLLHLALTKDPRFQEIQAILGRDGLGVIDRIELLTVESPRSTEPDSQPNSVYWLIFQPSMQASPNARGFPFANLSSGTQRVIRILVSLIFDQSSLMLLEHPEDSIHQGLLRKLTDLLARYADQSQLIVSSHSAIVFNSLDAPSIRLVTMEEGSTHVRALTGKEFGVVGRFLEEEGSLSDLLETVQED